VKTKIIVLSETNCQGFYSAFLRSKKDFGTKGEATKE
jgi:hypothetical protein